MQNAGFAKQQKIQVGFNNATKIPKKDVENKTENIWKPYSKNENLNPGVDECNIQKKLIKTMQRNKKLGSTKYFKMFERAKNTKH